jgi:hypothetical protein
MKMSVRPSMDFESDCIVVDANHMAEIIVLICWNCTCLINVAVCRNLVIVFSWYIVAIGEGFTPLLLAFTCIVNYDWPMQTDLIIP